MQKITIYHVNDGPTEMYPVDAQQAVGNFPDEWSREPWPEKAKGGRPKNGKDDGKEVERLKNAVDSAKRDVGAAERALKDAKERADDKAIEKAQGDLEEARARLSVAQAEFDAVNAR